MHELLTKNWLKAVPRELDEPTYRVWRLYLAAWALEF